MAEVTAAAVTVEAARVAAERTVVMWVGAEKEVARAAVMKEVAAGAAVATAAAPEEMACWWLLPPAARAAAPHQLWTHG